MTGRSRIRLFWRNRDGATAIEYAFVLPVFLMMLFGVINVAQLASALGGMHFAVEEAARCWAVNSTTCGTSSAAIAYAQGRYAGPDIGPVFAASTAGCGRTITATATYDLNVAIEDYSVPLSAAACYPAPPPTGC